VREDATTEKGIFHLSKDMEKKKKKKKKKKNSRGKLHKNIGNSRIKPFP